MNKKYVTLFAMTAVLTLSSVSCGPENEENNSVPELPVLSTEADTTEETTTETVTEVKTEAATTVSTEADEETTTEATTEITTEEEEKTEAPTEEQEDEPQEEEQPDEPEQQEPQEVKFSFDTLLNDVSGVVASLGEPVNVSTAPSCYTNGADSKIYEYDGVKIECYVLDGVENVCVVTITNSNYSTDKGITIGSSQADVEAAYGAGETAGDYTIYYSGDKELDVKFIDGAAAELIFYTAV
ncbi:MAG: hypothetical protein IKV85_05680 [Ruminococcus sp.]|nr:hypothetical protein [Ruminococcus sp.]